MTTEKTTVKMTLAALETFGGSSKILANAVNYLITGTNPISVKGEKATKLALVVANSYLEEKNAEVLAKWENVIITCTDSKKNQVEIAFPDCLSLVQKISAVYSLLSEIEATVHPDTAPATSTEALTLASPEDVLEALKKKKEA